MTDYTTEAIVDALIASLNEFTETDSYGGGCSDVVDVQAIYFGDPGIIPPHLYPAFLVQPTADSQASFVETTGYEVRELSVILTLLIDARQYFNVTETEAVGDRRMVRVMDALSKWLRVDARRSLNGLAGVRDVRVERTEYLVQVRGDMVAKSAQIIAAVTFQRPRQR